MSTQVLTLAAVNSQSTIIPMTLTLRCEKVKSHLSALIKQMLALTVFDAKAITEWEQSFVANYLSDLSLEKNQLETARGLCFFLLQVIRPAKNSQNQATILVFENDVKTLLKLVLQGNRFITDKDVVSFINEQEEKFQKFVHKQSIKAERKALKHAKRELIKAEFAERSKELLVAAVNVDENQNKTFAFLKQQIAKLNSKRQSISEYACKRVDELNAKVEKLSEILLQNTMQLKDQSEKLKGADNTLTQLLRECSQLQNEVSK